MQVYTYLVEELIKRIIMKLFLECIVFLAVTMLIGFVLSLLGVGQFTQGAIGALGGLWVTGSLVYYFND